MGDNKYFREALSDFTFDAAYGDSIRHLHNSGYSAEQIQEYLNVESLSVKRIQEVIDKHTGLETDTGLSDNKKTGPGSVINNSSIYEFVKEYDAYGRSTFVRRKKEN